jgi:hypothetical protein
MTASECADLLGAFVIPDVALIIVDYLRLQSKTIQYPSDEGQTLSRRYRNLTQQRRARRDKFRSRTMLQRRRSKMER